MFGTGLIARSYLIIGTRTSAGAALLHSGLTVVKERVDWYGKYVPVILRYKGYKFFFFANEGMPLEPLHIHVRKAEATAKYWVKPTTLAESYSMTSAELKELFEVVKLNEALIERSWNEFFGSKTTGK